MLQPIIFAAPADRAHSCEGRVSTAILGAALFCPRLTQGPISLRESGTSDAQPSPRPPRATHVSVQELSPWIRGGPFFSTMKREFTGTESWLKIPIKDLTWDDLPRDFEGRSAAICILALREMPYSEYLQTEHWHQVRLAAIRRHLNQCLCGKDAKDVHHVNYDRKGFEKPEDVVALCRECHQRWHETWVLQAKSGLAR